MLYGSLYKVFQQLSKQKERNRNNKLYDELIIPNFFLKILLHEENPKNKLKLNNNKITIKNNNNINADNNSNDVEEASSQAINVLNFDKNKSRRVTPIIKNHYINKPNVSLPKIKFKKKLSILTKKNEDLKNKENHEFAISEAILKQMQKTYYPLSSHVSNKNSKDKIKISKNCKSKDKDKDNNDNYKIKSHTVKNDDDSEDKKILSEVLKDKVCSENKLKIKNFQVYNKINIISNNNDLQLSKNKKENSFLLKNDNEPINRNVNKDLILFEKSYSTKNKSHSRLLRSIKDKQINDIEACKDNSKENNIDKNINNNINNININLNNYINKKDKNKNNININKTKSKKEFFISPRILNIKSKIKTISNAMSLYSISILNNFKYKYNNLEEINKKVSKNMIEFPLTKNILVSNDIFYYRVNKMYRNQLIKYMSHRLNWEIVDNNANNNTNSEQKFINFEWKYYSQKINYKNYKYDYNLPTKKLKMINLFEKNYEIGNKKNMFINMINYCDAINMNVFDIVPFTIIVSNSKYVEDTLDIVQAIMEFVEVNKYHKSNLISNKKYNDLFYYDKNYDSLKNQYIIINKSFLSSKNYWIIKPTDLYQGKCIEISNSYEEIAKKSRNLFKGVDKRFHPTQLNINRDNNEELNNNEKLLTSENFFGYSDKKNIFKKKIINSRMYCPSEIIIQKYLDNPFLYKKRKFDIRCFVLVDSNLNVFFCREGHLKGCSESYNLNNTNKFIHITNHSLQKKSNNFELYEIGNEMSYQDFKNFMVSENIPLEKFDDMINQMKLLVKISFKSVGNKLLKTMPILCFEIFGYDFILDKDFKLWILEINNNPGLGISSPLIEKLIPRMIDDAFRLTIDKVFNTRYSKECIDENGNYKSKYKLDGFRDDEIIFEFLCNLN